MFLENLVFDAVDPRRLGRFWEAALGCETLADQPDAFETRLSFDGGAYLDLCFQQVPAPPAEPLRLHLDLQGDRQAEEVERLIALGATPLDIGQGDVPWVVLGDPEGNPFCVLPPRAAYAGTGPIAGLLLDSADPERDAAFWSWLTGWMPAAGQEPHSLRHPSGHGPFLELCPEPAAKGSSEKGEGAKNRMHLDVRLQEGDDPDAVAAGIAARGGRELHPNWGELPWRVYADPSGNEFCVLPYRPAR